MGLGCHEKGLINLYFKTRVGLLIEGRKGRIANDRKGKMSFMGINIGNYYRICLFRICIFSLSKETL